MASSHHNGNVPPLPATVSCNPSAGETSRARPSQGPKVGSAMATFVYKAYDQLGNKKAGKIAVPSEMDARRELRDHGLSAYFLQDLHAFKRRLKKRKKRQRVLAIGGVIAIAAAMLLSGLMVGYAGREQALTVEDYQAAGVAMGGSGNFVVDTDQGARFARKIYEAWHSFAPGVVNGIEVHKHFMALYVSRKVSSIDDDDLELLATSTVRAVQREYDSAGATLLNNQDDVPIMENKYNRFTKSTKNTHYK